MTSNFVVPNLPAKKVLVILGFVVFLSFVSSNSPQAQNEPLTSQSTTADWHGLVPLRSTRRDVESLLGRPQANGGSVYESDEATVFVEYGDGPCEKGWPYGWNVKQDTVISIVVTPRKTVPLADLVLDQERFVRVPDRHISTTIHYVNRTSGISVTFDEIRARVMSISYNPGDSDLTLKCSDALNRLPPGREQSDYFFKFDAYGALPSRDEHERLDKVAAELVRSPQTEVYVIVYAGAVASAGEAKVRAACAQNYLIKKHHIEPARIHAIDGGYKQTREVEIYVETKGGPIPLPRPSLRPSKVVLSKRSVVECNN